MDLEQQDFQIFDLPDQAGGPRSSAAQKKEQQVLKVVMDPKNQASDEQFIQEAMQPTQEDMREQSKSDQVWFEEAATSIREARKFQYLIQR